MRRYPVIQKREKGMVTVFALDGPGVQTFGDDEQEALARAVDALETMFMAMIEDRRGYSLAANSEARDKKR